MKLLDTFIDKQEATYKKESTFLVMEFMKMDLYNLIHVDNYKFSEADLKTIVHQILSGLSCLHKFGVLHRVSSILYHKILLYLKFVLRKEDK